MLNQHCPRLATLVVYLLDIFSRALETSPPSMHDMKRHEFLNNIPKTITNLAVFASAYGMSELLTIWRPVCWLATPDIKNSSIQVIRIFHQYNYQDLWTTPISVDDMPVNLTEDLSEDSPDDLFGNKLQRGRFIGALRRLTAWGIRVDFPDGRQITELD